MTFTKEVSPPPSHNEKKCYRTYGEGIFIRLIVDDVVFVTLMTNDLTFITLMTVIYSPFHQTHDEDYLARITFIMMMMVPSS